MSVLGLNRTYETVNSFVAVSGVDLKTGDIEVGVPQRSCHGPLLFLIYINDLPLAVHDSSVSI